MGKVEKNIKNASQLGKPKSRVTKGMRTIRIYSLQLIKPRKLADKLSMRRRSAQGRKSQWKSETNSLSLASPRKSLKRQKPLLQEAFYFFFFLRSEHVREFSKVKCR